MNDFETWLKHNEDYLTTALTWLRLRLQAFIDGGLQPLATPHPATGSQVTGSLFNWMNTGSAPSPVPETALGRAAGEMIEAETGDSIPALRLLEEHFSLSAFEKHVLLLCAAMELDTRIPGLCARAQDDVQRPYPTFALALALFDDPTWDALSPGRPLRSWRLIEISQPGPLPLTICPLRADERIVNYIKGLNAPDDRLAPLLVPFDVPLEETELPPSQQQVVDLAMRYLQTGTSGTQNVIQLLGHDSISKQMVALHAATRLGLDLRRLPAELLPASVAELETLSRLWARESLLSPVVLYLDAHKLDGSPHSEQPEAQAPPLHRFLARSHGLFFLGIQDIWSGLGPTTNAIEVDRPLPNEQQAVWTQELDEVANAFETAETEKQEAQRWAAIVRQTAVDRPSALAGQFDLNQVTIQQIVWTTATEPQADANTLQRQLWDGCLVSTRPQMDLLAQRLDPKATWDDIVLPDETETLLQQIAAQVGQRSKVYNDWGFRQRMNRGLGISTLFAGQSGTGKTMAAEVIANELRLNLYRIDLSAVISKYIGETEKNLRRLFDVAEQGGAVLFFDEADALFGKRSEVKDSHDRYANIEINYLLQRMEAYRGLAILATNMKSALDHAFMRRLRFIVNFPFPGPNERKLIWERVFPQETPTKDLDLNRLARFNLTGGSIHNIALNAAFLAAQAGTDVTMPLILQAARTEYRKLELPVNEGDFQ